jgi:hypothetical protein
MPDELPQSPLHYRNPADDLPPPRGQSASVFLGMVSGVVVIVICGFCDAFQNLDIGGVPTTAPAVGLNKSFMAFSAIAIIAIVLGILLIRKKSRRFILLGFLLGVALASIMEGICFSRA